MEPLQSPSRTRDARSRAQKLLSDLDAGAGKLPPQAPELEEAVLGALMLEKEAIDKVVDILHPESFYRDAHQRIYHAVQVLFQKSEPIDFQTVAQQLKSEGALDFVGGYQYLMHLTTKVSSAAHIESHGRYIAELALKREMIRIAGEVLREGYEDTTDAFDLMDKAEKQLFDLRDANTKGKYQNISDILLEALKELEAKKDHQDGLTGVPTGFSDLDRLTSGWQRSDLIILAARPGMGKTAFVVTAARNAAVMFKKPVALFSLEMSSIQLVNRLISAETELESEKLRKGNLSQAEWKQLHQKIKQLEDAPIYIDDTPALSIMELRAKARRLRATYGIELIIIDYLQLMSGEVMGKTGNREQEISSISRGLKGLAKELNIPVIALSQLSRAVESRGGDKRPMLSDLRESGAIEQDADMVLFLYRPEYYQIPEFPDGAPSAGMGEVIVAKHRNGSLDDVRLRFIGQFTKFANADGWAPPSGGGDFGGDSGGGFPSGGNGGGGFGGGGFGGMGGMAEFDGPVTVTVKSKMSNKPDSPAPDFGQATDEVPF